jgi:hypothetical protein
MRNATLGFTIACCLAAFSGPAVPSTANYGWYPTLKVTNATSSTIDSISVRFTLWDSPNDAAWVPGECTDSNSNVGYLAPGKSGVIRCNPNYQGRISKYRFRRMSVTFQCYEGPGYSDGRVIYTKHFPENNGFYDAAPRAGSMPIPGVLAPIVLEESTFIKIYYNEEDANERCFGAERGDRKANAPREREGQKKTYKKEGVRPFQPKG